ncbi:magnesium transporter [Pseudomonas sp. F1_0610]|uniref:magnesium transporter n=1 Tax=Pseudomonas sp. F1_0610 TaxID=3114284 RepID=UPI0039C432E6
MSNTNNLAQVLSATIENNQLDNALAAVKSLRPIDLSDVLEQLDPALAWRLLELLPNRAEVYSYFEPEEQVRFAREFPRASLAKLVGEMPSDERTDLFKRLDQNQRDALLPALAQAEREDIRRLSAYLEGTAGAIMTSDYATLKQEMTVEQALAALRLEAPDAETIYHAYVIDEGRKLLGVVSLRQLILASPETSINELMISDFISAQVTERQEAIAKKMARYDLLALPITDDTGALIGIVTYDDAMDIVSEEATEDFLKSGGVVAEPSFNIKEATFGLMYRKRVFWLVFLVFGNLFSGAGIAHFEDIIAANLVLVFFLPLLVDSGGNAGSQSATLMVRALATGDVVMKDWLYLVGRECIVALLLGASMAVAVSILGFIRGDELVALVLALSMVSIVLIGCIIGMSLPFALSRLGFDPASASSPLITSICDASGVVIYLFIAAQILADVSL